MNKAFIKRSIWGFGAAAVRTVGGWAVHKLFAVYLGAAGVTLLSHLQNFFSLYTQPLTDGTHKALIRFISGNGDNEERNFADVFGTIWWWNLLFIVLLSLSIWLFGSSLLDAFSWSSAVWLGMLGVVLALVMQSFAQSILLAEKKVKEFAWLTAVGSLLMIGISLYGVLSKELNLALYYYALSQIVLSLLFVVYLYYCSIPIKFTLKPSKELSKKIGSFMLMAGSVWVFTKLTDFIVRDYAIDYFGMYETGLWQACDRLSQGYRGLYIATLSAVFYPQVSAMLNNKQRLRPYLFSVYKSIIPLSGLFFLMVYFYREEVLFLFYAPEFVSAADLFTWQIYGDVFSFLSFPLSLILMARMQTKMFIALQAISALTYILILLFAKQWGVEVFVIAWLIRQVVYFLINVIVNIKLLVNG